ncbi:MAG: metal ABC transporter permease [Rhizobiaceae bacterium]
MLDDFFTRALVAGIGVALIAGPFGCFIVWRRIAYYGDTLAHSALLGVALALLFQVNIMLSVFAVAFAISLMLFFMQRQNAIASDAVLGMLSHTSLALGLIALGFMTWVRVDIMGILTGDILAVTKSDILLIYAGGAVLLLALASIWKPLFAATVDLELAEAEAMNPKRANLIFLLLMSLVIAISMKLVGVLLVTALLIIPATTARRFATGPEQMAFLAALAGVISVVAGLFASLQWDTPSGPSIVVAAFILFLAASVSSTLRNRKQVRG